MVNASELLTCVYCGRKFERPAGRGPAPKYCSGAHRQAAHRQRWGIKEVKTMSEPNEPLRAHVGRNLGLSPERAVRLLRAKAAELESMVPSYLDEIKVVHPSHFAQDIRKLYEMAGNTLADIALVAGLLADHIEMASVEVLLPPLTLHDDTEPITWRPRPRPQRPRIVVGDPNDPSTWVERDPGDGSDGAGTLIIPPELEARARPRNPLDLPTPEGDPPTGMTEREVDRQIRQRSKDYADPSEYTLEGWPTGESPISEWHAGDPPGPGEPGDASDAT